MPRLINAFEQFFDGSGNPLISGQLEFYESGSSTMLKTTFANLDETVANPNPVILSADGRAPNIFGTGAYRVVLKNSAGTKILIRDPVGGDDALVFGAEWSAVISYSEDDIVYDGVEYWISIVNNNISNIPSSDDGSNWAQVNFSKKITAVKTEDTPRASTTTRTPDPHLSIPLKANAIYSIEGFIIVDDSNGTGNASIQPIAGPGSWNPSASAVLQEGSTIDSFTLDFTSTVWALTIGTTNEHFLRFRGTIETDATAGTWTVDWAQQSSNAAPTTLHKTSYISAERIDV